MKYIVYQVVNKVNGKLYIGVHKTENPEIFDGYIGGGIRVGYKLEHPTTLYQRALKKYGYKNFIRTTLYIFDDMEEAYAKEAEIVNMEFVKRRDTYNTKLGGIHNNFVVKQLYQFDFNGNLLRSWDTSKEAEEYYGCCTGRFRIAIDKKIEACGYYWSFQDHINPKEYSKHKYSEIYQFDIDGNFLNKYSSLPELVKETGYNYQSISEAVNKKKLYRKCWWTKDPEKIIEIIKLNQLYNLNHKAIQMFDLDNNLIQEFNSIIEASKILGFKYGSIKSAIRCSRPFQGYIFKYISPIKKNSTKIEQIDPEGNVVKVWDNITQCAKEHPKCREVLKGVRAHTHGYTFKYILED